MARSRAALRIAAVALTVGVTVPACAPPDGPLVSSDAEGVEVCTPQDASGRSVITTSGIRVTGDDGVTVTAVSLVDADGLQLIGFDFGAFDGDFAVNGGDYAAHGPSAIPTTRLEAGHSYAVKVGLVADPTGGSAAAVAIDYQVNGSADAFTTRTRVAMVIAPAGASCG